MHDDLDHFANVGGEGTRHGVDAAVGKGALDGGEFEAVIFVERDKIGFFGEGIEPWAIVLSPDDAAVGDHLMGADCDASGYFCGKREVWIGHQGFEFVIEPAQCGIREGEGRFGWGGKYLVLSACVV